MPKGGQQSRNSTLASTYAECKRVFECACGRLKVRFPMRRMVIDINIDDIPYVMYSCFALHNYCKALKDLLAHNNICEAISYDRDFQPPTQNVK